VSDPGVELKLDGDGEICLRSAYLCDGSFDDPAATTEALRDGWFHSGDLGEVDDGGHLYVVGRKKDVIRSGGESVAPSEVEAALADHPGIADVAVVGIPDPEWGEVVCAIVVPMDGERVDLASLRKHCEGRIAGFKKPRRIARIEAIPRTAAPAQIQRPLLVEQLQSGALPTER
jgi:acyl-CoA synthetase (AMP-forming)/AMP-acid ligase II